MEFGTEERIEVGKGMEVGKEMEVGRKRRDMKGKDKQKVKGDGKENSSPFQILVSFVFSHTT